MKRIVTVQDISCLGKCSLTVALPVISAMGIETSIIPTAVLSAHTIFEGHTFRDLTNDIPSIGKHWIKEGFNFDAIYTGYLGSQKQIEIMLSFFNDFKSEKNFILVDPVMADGGELYDNFNSEFPSKMRMLCEKADVITPNLTEACLLTESEYKKKYDEKYIDDIIFKLSEIGAKNIVLKGVELNGRYGIICQSGKERRYITHEKLQGTFYGTGDIFASVLTGAMTLGESVFDAANTAADFTLECIKLTVKDNDSRFYGVNFEDALPLLTNKYIK